jgi:hypothetical protein
MTLRIRGEGNQLTEKMHPALLRVERCISSPARVDPLPLSRLLTASAIQRHFCA